MTSSTVRPAYSATSLSRVAAIRVAVAAKPALLLRGWYGVGGAVVAGDRGLDHGELLLLVE
ncbi:hypothetical protein, partial [Streptomyces sp. NPDC052127]|uniref:hypothetical protein n=1 Tax=Streptomyces sp. NPDC052127 TaxID=3155679 RepID=UPI0034126DEF